MKVSQEHISNANRSPSSPGSVPWALKLYRRSVLKQEKFRAIERFLPNLKNKSCLDIGGDNGVISYLLRRKGGAWHSADHADAVESIREIVSENVHSLRGARLPFGDGSFDLVVVIDYMEHIQEDGVFVKELSRVLRPGGEVIVNVPHAKPGALLRPVRLALGLTDERHGHVRPGYRREELRRLLGRHFAVKEVTTYSRFFSHAIDTAFGFLYGRLGKGKGEETSKGIIVTQKDSQGEAKGLLVASLLYPFCQLLVQLNRLLFFTRGYLLLVRAEKTGGAA
jgi:ubiquinone/menaquinone biosynthesis C-methylase UbiE